jgi:hypothetical protein
MGKLQPNFSWQKYEGNLEDAREQFQYQLQSQYLTISSAFNATINDLSFWTRERATGFTWVTGQELYTQTYATTAWTAGGTVNTIPLNLTAGPKGQLQVVYFSCVLSNGMATSSTSIPVPYVDVSVPANSIQLQRVGENIVLTSGGTNYSTYSGYVTIYYVKG